MQLRNYAFMAMVGLVLSCETLGQVTTPQIHQITNFDPWESVSASVVGEVSANFVVVKKYGTGYFGSPAALYFFNGTNAVNATENYYNPYDPYNQQEVEYSGRVGNDVLFEIKSSYYSSSNELFRHNGSTLTQLTENYGSAYSNIAGVLGNNVAISTNNYYTGSSAAHWHNGAGSVSVSNEAYNSFAGTYGNGMLFTTSNNTNPYDPAATGNAYIYNGTGSVSLTNNGAGKRADIGQVVGGDIYLRIEDSTVTPIEGVYNSNLYRSNGSGSVSLTNNVGGGKSAAFYGTIGNDVLINIEDRSAGSVNYAFTNNLYRHTGSGSVNLTGFTTPGKYITSTGSFSGDVVMSIDDRSGGSVNFQYTTNIFRHNGSTLVPLTNLTGGAKQAYVAANLGNRLVLATQDRSSPAVAGNFNQNLYLYDGAASIALSSNTGSGRTSDYYKTVNNDVLFSTSDYTIGSIGFVYNRNLFRHNGTSSINLSGNVGPGREANFLATIGNDVIFQNRDHSVGSINFEYNSNIYRHNGSSSINLSNQVGPGKSASFYRTTGNDVLFSVRDTTMSAVGGNYQTNLYRHNGSSAINLTNNIGAGYSPQYMGIDANTALFINRDFTGGNRAGVFEHDGFTLKTVYQAAPGENIYTGQFESESNTIAFVVTTGSGSGTTQNLFVFIRRSNELIQLTNHTQTNLFIDLLAMSNNVIVYQEHDEFGTNANVFVAVVPEPMSTLPLAGALVFGAAKRRRVARLQDC